MLLIFLVLDASLHPLCLLLLQLSKVSELLYYLTCAACEGWHEVYLQCDSYILCKRSVFYNVLLH